MLWFIKEDRVTNKKPIKKNVAIFISGTGSNMQALIEASLSENYPAQICCVISDVATAKGLETANNYGIKNHFIDPKSYKSKVEYEKALNVLLSDKQIDFVCLAGFMRLFSSYMCNFWEGKMINIHPSLLPAFKGLNTHQRALDMGVAFSGCTIHYVSSEMDSGKIIAQAAVPVYNDDNVDSLAKRVQSAEHILYPKILQMICEAETKFERHSFYYMG